jgi:hypothetical protein
MIRLRTSLAVEATSLIEFGALPVLLSIWSFARQGV